MRRRLPSPSRRTGGGRASDRSISPWSLPTHLHSQERPRVAAAHLPVLFPPISTVRRDSELPLHASLFSSRSSCSQERRRVFERGLLMQVQAQQCEYLRQILCRQCDERRLLVVAQVPTTERLRAASSLTTTVKMVEAVLHSICRFATLRVRHKIGLWFGRIDLMERFQAYRFLRVSSMTALLIMVMVRGTMYSHLLLR